MRNDEVCCQLESEVKTKKEKISMDKDVDEEVEERIRKFRVRLDLDKTLKRNAEKLRNKYMSG